jgi:hypothetical protein
VTVLLRVHPEAGAERRAAIGRMRRASSAEGFDEALRSILPREEAIDPRGS